MTTLPFAAVLCLDFVVLTSPVRAFDGQVSYFVERVRDRLHSVHNVLNARVADLRKLDDPHASKIGMIPG